MDVDTFRDEVANWIGEARDPRWKRPYTDLVYQPQIELLDSPRASATAPTSSPAADRTSCASMRSALRGPARAGGRHCGRRQLSIRREREPVLIKEPKLLLNDDNAGKPEGIHLMIGHRPYFAFGNSTGDRQMLEYTKAGGGVRLAMLVLHDDARARIRLRARAGPARHESRPFPPELYDEATKDGWIVVSMKNDWKRIFAFE